MDIFTKYHIETCDKLYLWVVYDGGKVCVGDCPTIREMLDIISKLEINLSKSCK